MTASLSSLKTIVLFSEICGAIVAQIETYFIRKYHYTGLESLRFQTRFSSALGPSTGLQRKYKKYPPDIALGNFPSCEELGDAENEPTQQTLYSAVRVQCDMIEN